jgi:hypothetical protein
MRLPARAPTPNSIVIASLRQPLTRLELTSDAGINRPVRHSVTRFYQTCFTKTLEYSDQAAKPHLGVPHLLTLSKMPVRADGCARFNDSTGVSENAHQSSVTHLFANRPPSALPLPHVRSAHRLFRSRAFRLKLGNFASTTRPPPQRATFANCRHDAGNSKTAATTAATVLLTFYFCLFSPKTRAAPARPYPVAIKSSAP